MAFAAGEKRSWLHAQGIRFFPVVGWAERGGYGAIGHGNSVPRFHLTWGTGPGVVEPFERRVREAASRGLINFKFRHRVDAITMTNGMVEGVSGAVLEPTNVARGKSSSRAEIGDICVAGAGRDRRLGRDRRQPRAGAAKLARASWAGAEDNGRWRARPCRRPHDRHHAKRRGSSDQSRSDVALRRGPAQFRSDLAEPRHPHSARTIFHVV